MNPSPLATIAQPQTDSMAARLARVNRGSSGITGVMQDNGTPFLTNRPEAVDALSDTEVGSAVDGGQPDPRALLRMLIGGNATRGRGASAELAAVQPLQEEAVRQRVGASAGDFRRQQGMLDTASEADAYFLPQVRRQRLDKNADALEQMEARTSGDRARASADIYGSDLDYDAKIYGADRGYEGEALKALSGAYGDELGAGAMNKSIREQGGAGVLRDLIQQLLMRGQRAPQ